MSAVQDENNIKLTRDPQYEQFVEMQSTASAPLDTIAVFQHTSVT